MPGVGESGLTEALMKARGARVEGGLVAGFTPASTA